MADTVKVKMLRGVGGFEEGATREMSAADAKRLAARGVVEITGKSVSAAPANKAEPAPANKAGAFDHDGDGSPGGSKKGAGSTRARGAAKRKRK